MNKKKLKRREEKEGNNKKKRSKSYTKKEKPKQLRLMVAPVHFDPNIAERISEAAMGGAGGRGPILHSLCGPVERKKPLGGPIDLIYF
jgi:hypothetical protein